MNTSQDAIDKMYMRRCIQLAKQGYIGAKPNPMVGAVIVHNNLIIGEGYHVQCGKAHAEVNAFASVKALHQPLLPQSTLYVSLEPCCHYGKTPPCADLIISKHIKRVVCGCIDTFAKVHGKGIERLRNAGIEVKVGVLEDECKLLNRKFNVLNTYQRPYILLKWAQTANGFIDDNGKAIALSSPFTQMLVHQLRSQYDAILVGGITDRREHPQLNVREWSGNNPLRLVLHHDTSIPQLLNSLYHHHIQSLIVEGGTKTLQSFIAAGLWDEIRIETSPISVSNGTPSPLLPTSATITFAHREVYQQQVIDTYYRV